MHDYKNSLNLPKTDFPMKANLPQREPEQLARWQQMDIYQQLRQHCQGRPRFVLHDGPPYANARPHMGTALNKTLKDIVVKSRLLSGYDAPFVPGWDCHGLPIELNVEKQIGKPGEQVDHKTFRAACRDYAATQVQLQLTDFQRMGIIADWQHPYLTMDFHYEANVVRAIGHVLANGYLARGVKPVHWCPLCHSALAEAEVEYKDKTSSAIDVAFVAVDSSDILKRFGLNSALANRIELPIWTTTPWTLPANQAVCLHAEIEYTLVHAQLAEKAWYGVIANDLLATVMQRYGANNYESLATVKGEVLAGLILQHPYLDRVVPIILGEHVTTEAGTSSVHTAPAHGEDDFRVSQQYGLEIQNPLTPRSLFRDDVPIVGGQHVYKVNDQIIGVLKEKGVLLHIASIQHSYPHCWRHKTPLIFWTTPQWFIAMDKTKLREQALAAIKTVQWLPSWGENRITKMIETRPDWCISRQRSWGAPLTLFIHEQTGEIHPDMPALIEKIAHRIEQTGMEAWYELDPITLLGEQAQDYIKVTDTLDVWFDSGCSQFSVLDQREELQSPADVYLEGSDQHRGWFQSSLLASLATKGTSPFLCVLTHAYVVDKNGDKMSKSLGNTILPQDIINKMGADVMRLWIASTDFQTDIAISDEILQRSADAYRRIRNTLRFLLSNLYDFNPQTDCVPAKNLVALDAWALQRTRELQAEILNYYNSYQIHLIYQAVHNFVTVELGSFYLDIIKDRLYTCKANGSARRSAQTVLYHMTEAMVRWLAPILSFTAEEVWQCLPGSRANSVFFSTWYQAWDTFDFQTALSSEDWQQLMAVRNEVNKALEKARQENKLGGALEAHVHIFADANWQQKLTQLGEELRFVLITSGASVHSYPANLTAEMNETALPGIAVHIEVLTHSKCERCWQRLADVGQHADHPTLCSRCVVNYEGAGEDRVYA